MGKKITKKNSHKKGKFNNNIPSSKKSKKKNNLSKLKQMKSKHKRTKSNSFFNNLSLTKRDKILNQSNHTFNHINNNNINPFIFNSFFNNKKEKERPEWMDPDTEKIQNINNRFNKEIFEYVNYIIPKNISLYQRQNTKQRLTNIIKKYQPNWRVVLFGSFSQNTSTIFSDLDFAVLSNDLDSSRKMDINELIYLLKILKREGFSRNIRLIRARVPILKATCSLTGINVDISVNRENGYEAAGIIRNILKRYKILRPTIIILKILLKKNNLNDAHTGGMSSFLLFHLVYFFYIIYIKRTQKNEFNNNLNMKMSEKEENSIESNNIEDNEDENDSGEDKDITYDSNSELKFNGKNKKINEDGIIISKAISSTDEEDNSDDSNLVKNGNSSSNSEEDQKVNYSYNGNNYNSEDINDDKNDEEDDKLNESEDIEYFSKKNIDEETYKNSNGNNGNKINIGDFFFNLLKFYAKEFDYENLGFSLNENNFGITFFKVERNDMICSDFICVESIQEQGVDIGRSCYNYQKIVKLFKNTYSKIKFEKQRNSCSILQALGFPSI